MILGDEIREHFDELHEGLLTEHKPQTPTEILLVESMTQHYWPKQRALRLQTLSFDLDPADAEKNIALFLRYQTTHDRGFHKALNTLLKLRVDKRKAQLDEAALCQRVEDSKKIGFVSQEHKHAEHTASKPPKNANKGSTNGKFCTPKPKSTTAFC